MVERMVFRLGRPGGAIGIALVALACGGRSLEWAPALENERDAGLDEPAVAAPDPPQTASAPEPPPEPPPELPPEQAPLPCTELTIGAELAWAGAAEEYGLEGPGMLSFSPDGGRLVTTGDASAPAVVTFDVATGALVRQSVDAEIVYGRDAGWSLELRGRDNVLRAIDLADGGDAFRRDLERKVLGAAVSGDGRSVGVLTCKDGVLTVARWELERDATSEISVKPCEPYAMDPSVILTRDGSEALVASGSDGTVARIDFERSSVMHAALHPATDSTQSVFALALSADGTLGLSAGAEGVRAWSYPALTPLFGPVPPAVGSSFSNCYTLPRRLAALAFSPDGRFLTTPGEAGTLTIRRSCDFAPILTLERPLEPYCSYRGSTPPGLSTFSPAGDRLAVWWGGVVGLYRLIH
jgi:WD40 repeat protein